MQTFIKWPPPSPSGNISSPHPKQSISTSQTNNKHFSTFESNSRQYISYEIYTAVIMKFSGLFALVLASALTCATSVTNVDKGVIINGCTTTYPNKRDMPATATASGHEADYTNPKSCEVFAAAPEIRVPALFLGAGVLAGIWSSL
jgi:hypothetical protein